MPITPVRVRGTPEWDALSAHFAKMRDVHLRDLFAEDPLRADEMTVEAADLVLDYSKNRLTPETVRLLVALAERAGLRERIEAMFSGEHINVTEDRAVLHMALRAPEGTEVDDDGHNVVPDVHKVLDKMSDFAEAVRSGTWRGFTGQADKEHRQYRHRGFGPRAGHGLRGSYAVLGPSTEAAFRVQCRRGRHMGGHRRH